MSQVPYALKGEEKGGKTGVIVILGGGALGSHTVVDVIRPHMHSVTCEVYLDDERHSPVQEIQEEWSVRHSRTEAGRIELPSHTLAKEDRRDLWLFVSKTTFQQSGAPVWDEQDNQLW